MATKLVAINKEADRTGGKNGRQTEKSERELRITQQQQFIPRVIIFMQEMHSQKIY